jgi:hypothetical protein
VDVTKIEQNVVAEADKVRAEIKSDAEAAISAGKKDVAAVESKAVALWHKSAPWIVGAVLALAAIVYFVAKHR